MDWGWCFWFHLYMRKILWMSRNRLAWALSSDSMGPMSRGPWSMGPFSHSSSIKGWDSPLWQPQLDFSDFPCLKGVGADYFPPLLPESRFWFDCRPFVTPSRRGDEKEWNLDCLDEYLLQKQAFKTRNRTENARTVETGWQVLQIPTRHRNSERTLFSHVTAQSIWSEI